MKTAITWLLLCVSLISTAVQASTDSPETGMFLFRSDDGSWQPALLLNTDMQVQVSGPVAEVQIRQSFSNPGVAFAEGRYVLPTSEGAAVHAMTLEIGERRINGVIQEREQARKTYEQARDNGQQTGLVEQERPNLFTTSVANIGAGDTISVIIRYTEVLQPDAGRYSLRLPLTMTPRYNARPQPVDGQQRTAQGSSASPEGPIVGSLWRDGPSHQADIQVTLDSGFALHSLSSPSHAISSHFDGRQYHVQVLENPVVMDRDFVLNWQLPSEAGNQVAVFTEQVGDDHYALMMLSPAAAPVSRERQPREVFLILDTSGSMQGERLRQARDSLIHALGRLQPEDRFNVLEFNSEFSMLYREPVNATEDNLSEARSWVAGLPAGGGTEMLPVLRAALTQPNEPGYLRQLIFITDGSVSNEREVLRMIEQRLRQARVFTVGIGASPNSFLLRKAAEVGRGQFTSIDDRAGIGSAMERLFEKLESPVLTHLQLELPEGIEAEIWPQKLPDLYSDQPLLIAMKLNQLPEKIALHGQQPEAWEQHLQIPEPQQGNGIAKLWARRKIEAAMDRLNEGAGEDEVRDLVLPVALEHQLMSRFTSFVAVEEQPVRAADEPLDSQQVPNLNPVDHRLYPQTSLGLTGLWTLALALLLGAFIVLNWKPRHA